MSWIVPRLAVLIAASFLILGGCRLDRVKSPRSTGVDLSDVEQSIATMHSDVQKVRQADYSILFVGNSHTSMHNIPGLVAQMIKFTHPKKTVYTHSLEVMFLEQTAADTRIPVEIDNRPWKCVVLQAQKISQSGRYDYSKKEGIDLAKRAKVKGAEVVFYAEWGLRGVEGDGAKQENVYLSMAQASGARVASVGKAWDLAMTQDPALMLHAGDGNHQNPRGAFLTACVLYSVITGQDPAPLAQFPYEHAYDHERKFLADTASMLFKSDGAKKK